jgi:hypothetical protein
MPQRLLESPTSSMDISNVPPLYLPVGTVHLNELT